MNIHKLFISAIIFASVVSLHAQNPEEVVFTVNYSQDNGDEASISMSGVKNNSFKFLGGKGLVDHYTLNGGLVEEKVEEKNQNIYAWTSDSDYDKTWIHTNATELKNALRFGLFVSKKPNIQSEDTIIGTYGKTSLSCKDLNQNNSVVEYIYSDWHEVKTGVYAFSYQFTDMEYMTTYYFRPFVELDYNGQIMYGEEKSFTTPGTIQGILHNAPEFNGIYAYSDGIALSQKAINQIYESRKDKLGEFNQDNALLIRESWQSFATPEIWKSLKVDSTIECTDGPLFIVNSIPDKILKHYLKFSE